MPPQTCSSPIVCRRRSAASRGTPRTRTPVSTHESNAPQGWSASAVVLMVQAMLGILPIAPFGILCVDPHLPPWLPDLRLDDVRVGDARLDLHFWRTPTGGTRYRVHRRAGHVRVLHQPIAHASAGGRLWRALASLPRA